MAEERVLTRQELFDLVWSKPIQELAREFKLSDVGFAKACKRHNIPRPQRGHWQKVAVGRVAKKPALPGDPSTRVCFYLRDDPVPEPPKPEPVITPEVAAWIEREQDPKNRIRVLQTVRDYHPLVIAVKNKLEKREILRYDNGWRSSWPGPIFVHVTKRLVGRACRILHALLVGFEARGFRLRNSRENSETVVEILGEEFKFSLHEDLKRIRHVPTPEELARAQNGLDRPRKFDDLPSGQLRLQFESGSFRRSFNSDKRDLEGQLNEVVLALVRTVVEVIQPENQRRAKEAEARRLEEQKRWEFQQKCERFDNAYRAWAAHQERLRFLSALEEDLAKIEAPNKKVVEFLAWARRYVEWANPLPRFYDGIEKDQHVYFHEFTRNR